MLLKRDNLTLRVAGRNFGAYTGAKLIVTIHHKGVTVPDTSILFQSKEEKTPSE